MDLNIPSADGGYDFIMADPPWTFKTYSEKGITAKSAGGQYKCMTMQDIADMPIASFAAPNCLLWLCATNPMLPQQLEIMKAWGLPTKLVDIGRKQLNTANKRLVRATF